jgi:hypothetical protein
MAPVRLGPGRLGQRPGQTEVGDAEATVGVEQQIGRLDVPMDETTSVGVVETGGRFDPDLDGLFRREQDTGVERLAQAAAGQVLQHQVRLVLLLAPVVDLEDVGVVEGGHRPGLGPEPLEEGSVAGQGRMEDLDGDPAMKRDVVGQVDVRGRTGPQCGDESVAAAEDTPDGVGDTRHGSGTQRTEQVGPTGGGSPGQSETGAPSSDRRRGPTAAAAPIGVGAGRDKGTEPKPRPLATALLGRGAG